MKALRSCPKCAATQLVPSRAAEIEVDRCPDCGGWWFDESELPRLLAAPREEVRPLRKGRPSPAQNATRGTCPDCGRPLLRVQSAVHREVTLDACPDCRGVWLDEGEFAALQERTGGQ